MTQNNPVNLNDLAELKLIMEDDFQLLIDTFLNDSRQRITVLEKAIADGDANTIREYAHSFKGSSSNICAPYLADCCKELEALGRDNQLENAATVFTTVVDAFAAVETALSQV